VIYGASTLNNAKQFLKQVSIVFCLAYLYMRKVMFYTCLVSVGRHCLILDYELPECRWEYWSLSTRICHCVIWWPITQEIQLVPPEQW